MGAAANDYQRALMSDLPFIPVPKPAVYPKDGKFLAWLRRQRCLVCGLRQFVEAAHLDSCAYGDVGNAIPLCGFAHHREGKLSIHQMGKEKFAAHWQKDLRAAASEYVARYLRETA